MGEYLDWRRQNRNKGLSIQLSKLMKVRQIIAIEKVKETCEQLIEQCLQQDKKVIVFTNFTEPLMKYMKNIKKICYS